ncbi:MAG: MtnX-like HAD-IB family phosphatase [Anaerolineales bacterium]|nr:MtnX-like HAD-IB family phosphatase [Anaerolineales bacterium]
MLMQTSVCVLCDFDGTICETEVLGFLFREYAACGMEHVIRWQRGEIDMREEIAATFQTITATREEMERGLDQLIIPQDFIHFLQVCRARQYQFAVLSDGLEWYIRYLLARHGVGDIPVYANHLYFEQKGIRLEFPWFSENESRRGVCKSCIVRRYREQYNQVIYIGDGESDIHAVAEADLVFARNWLAEYCQENGIPAHRFSTWGELLSKWVSVLGREG